MPKILYFVRGNPTEQQRREAESLGAVFRNPDMVGKGGDFIEGCDEVYGGPIPAQYSEKSVAAAPGIQKTDDLPPDNGDESDTPLDDSENAEPGGDNQESAAPTATTLSIDETLAFNGMTVAKLREFAKANGISIPAAVNTKTEITEYLADVMLGAKQQ